MSAGAEVWAEVIARMTAGAAVHQMLSDTVFDRAWNRFSRDIRANEVVRIIVESFETRLRAA